MIITNWIAKVVVTMARINIPGTIGVTIYPFIFIYPKIYANNKRLIRHELKHIEQYKRYWIIGFPFIYIYQYIRYGYWECPLEQEARRTEFK